MGKLIDKIKELLFGNKIKMLPPGKKQNSYREDINNFRQQQRNYQQLPQVKNPYLEYALTEYFQEYLKQLDDMLVTGVVPSSYRVLTSINAVKGDSNQNLPYEKALLNKINQEGKYHVFEQKNNNTGKPAFYHIYSNSYKDIPHEDMIRIYLNCRDENVANLAAGILEYNNNSNFYMKFDSSEELSKRSRSEKIVIYTDEQHLNEDIQTIKNVKMQYPGLFKDSEKANPFIQQFDDTYLVVNQVKSGMYMDLQGNRLNLEKSTNTFIARILQDSYTQTVQTIAKRDPRLTFLLDDVNKNNYNLYVQNYPYIFANHHDIFMDNMEGNMKILAHNNNVIIKGVSTNTNESYRDENTERY